MSPTSPKVFGLGLSRTGTTSLTTALRRLGYDAHHFPLSILSYRDGAPTLNLGRAKRFEALTDTPVALLYRELDSAFPGSKFILTTRDTESWLASIRRLRTSYFFLKFIPKIRHLTKDLYGPEAYSNEESLKGRLKSHQDEVLAYFGDRIGKDLLVLDVRDRAAYKTLCLFLGKEPISAPFPHQNRAYRTTLSNLIDFFVQIYS